MSQQPIGPEFLVESLMPMAEVYPKEKNVYSALNLLYFMSLDVPSPVSVFDF